MKKSFSAVAVIVLAFLFPASIDTSWHTASLIHFSGASVLVNESNMAANQSDLMTNTHCLQLGELSASRYHRGMVSLEWRTTFEQGLEGFILERRDNTESGAFVRCGYVPALGRSQQPQRYRFLDQPATNEIYYYRLRAVDRNGACGYSQEVTLAQ